MINLTQLKNISGGGEVEWASFWRIDTIGKQIFNEKSREEKKHGQYLEVL